MVQMVRTFVVPYTFLWFFGYLYGVCLYFGGFMIYHKLMEMCYGMYSLSALDEFFLLDNEQNRANILTFSKFEKFKDPQLLRRRTIERIKRHPKLCAKLTKFCGEYFFEQLTGDALEKQWEKNLRVANEIRTYKELEEWVAKEANIRDPLDDIQYQLIWVPDFEKDYSLFAVKSHHCLIDGLSMVCLGNAWGDTEYRRSDFPNILPKENWL
jgi:hypothetical protein